jgi:hypothetical protein
MASIISADSGLVSGVPGLKTSADGSGILQLQTGNNVTALTVDASQNVGIGTITPAYKFDVVGDINIPATSSYKLGTASVISYSGGNVSFGDAGGNLFVKSTGFTGFYTAATERMRITAAGNILAGTTTDFTSTTVPGAVEVAGYGIYPYVTGNVTNTTVNTGVNFYTPTAVAGDNGLSTTTINGFASIVNIKNTGAGGVNPVNGTGFNTTVNVESSAVSGRVALRGAQVTVQRSLAADTSTVASNVLYGFQATVGNATTAPSTISGGNILGANFSIFNYSGTCNNTVAGALISLGAGSASGSNVTTTSSLIGVWHNGMSVGTAAGNAATVTTGAAFYGAGASVAASGTMTTYYGLYLGSSTVTGTLTNNWGVYSEDTAAKNYFGGNVGIGTTSPGDKLEISGNIKIGVSNKIWASNVLTSFIRLFNPSNNSLDISSSTAVRFLTGVGTDVETMRIDSSGNVGIGTSSPTTGYKLSLATGGIRLSGTQATAGVAGFDSQAFLIANSTYQYLAVVQAAGLGGGAVSELAAVFTRTSTEASAYTTSTAYGVFVSPHIKGAGSTIGTAVGINISDQTVGSTNIGLQSGVSSGSSKWNIYATGTADNYFAGNVGIGTVSPAAKLSLQQSSIGATTTVINAVTETTAAVATIFDFDQYSTVDGNGSSFVRFRKANGTAASPTLVGANRSTGRVGSQLYDGAAFYDNTLIRFSADGTPALNSTPGRIEFWTTPIGSAGGIVERMRIDSSGNVGIGTTSPSQKLSVAGNALIGTQSSTRIDIIGGGGGNAITETYLTETTPRWAIGRDLYYSGQAGIGFGPTSSVTIAAGGAAIGIPATSTLGFATSNGTALTERMRIFSSGGVSIGNTTDPGATNLSITGTVTATNHIGAGTGLTGTATSLSIGGNAAGLSATLAVSSGGTGLSSTPANGALDIGNGTNFTRTTLTQGTGITITNGAGSITIAGNTGTVTSVAQSFTGGIISVGGSPVTTSGTLALTVAGTSGGIPYFTSATAWASSAALAASALVIGGGAGLAPATTTTGTGVITALGVNTGTAGAFVVNGGALGTPSSGTLTNCTFPTLNQNTTGTAAGLSATLAVASGGTGVTTSTGTGSVVLSTSPSLTTPALGTPSSGTLTNCTFPTLNQNTTGYAASVVATVTGTNSTELVRGNMADNDQFRILVGGTASNAGFVEIATADDANEPIYVRQYSGVFTSIARTATLLDGSGNTTFPGSVTGTSFSGAGTGLTGTASSLSIGGNAAGLSATLAVSSGGTGLSSTPVNGALDIGNGTGFTRTTLTQGTGISITNGAGSITISSSGGVGITATVYTSTTTFTIPAGVTKLKVTVVGGGGNGGVNGSVGGGGGGGGGTAIVWLTGLTPGNTLVATVGGVGGTSSIASGTQVITTASATGGGAGGSNGSGGTGGAGSGGTININGGYGGLAASVSGTGTFSGYGGASFFAGEVVNVANAGTGISAIGRGGGGAGGVSTGGAGLGGVVVIEYDS